MKRRPLIFWVLLLAGCIATIWWAFYVPHNPQALFRAIPAQASWLTSHENLASRWDTISSNPLLASLASALEVEPEEWEELAQSEDTRKFLELLAHDEVVLAYVPELRATGRPAWVFGSWVGGRSQRFRWMLNSIKDPNLRRAASRNGWNVWVWTPKGLADGTRITFALVEGMLVGCIAPDTLGIEDVLMCYDGHLPSLAEDAEARSALTRDALDWGWVRMPQGNGWGPRIHYALNLQSGGALAGQLYLPSAPTLSTPAPSANQLDDFARLLGEHPAAALIVDRALARWWLDGALRSPVGREVEALLRGDESGSVALALVGGAYSGRFMAVRLPALLAAVTSADPVQAAQGMRSAFDRLNAATPWGLVPQPVSVGTQRVFAIESTGRSPYASGDAKERIAYVPMQQSLAFSSNLETLTKLLREAQQKAGGAESVLSQGAQRMRDHHALGYLWFNLEEGAKLLRLAVTAWSLKLLVENPQGSQEMRQKLNEAKAWIDAMAPQKTLQVWVRPRQDLLEYEFKLGGDE
ncbi:MAG: hypothetical protein H3C50_08645 [Kiritimatiellae bacterium]|nr:hypothetical protein [Kiritimatiellia bacterium]